MRHLTGDAAGLAEADMRGFSGGNAAARREPQVAAEADADDPCAKWERVRRRLKAELGETVYESWFPRVDLEGIEAGVVRLSVPTRFLKSWIQGHYADRLMQLWRGEDGRTRRIEIQVRSAARPRRVETPAVLPLAPQARADSAEMPSPVEARPAPTAEAGEDLTGSPLDQRLTFASFLVDRSNALAHAAARQIAGAGRGEAVAYNPLYIHAQVGLGKTHLLQAVAHEASASTGRRVLYLTAERFMYRFVRALQAQSALAFKDRLRGIDILLIDDLQFLHGRQMQQEFCHTLNSLIDGARQVVIASDRPPIELETLDERVRSRLAGGLVVEIGAPEPQLRREIVAARARAAEARYPDLTFPPAVIDYVAESIATCGRDLDGAVTRLIAHNRLTGTPISLEMAEEALKDLVRTREPRRVLVEDIQRQVAREFGVTKADLLSSRRTRQVVWPRQVAMYLAKVLTPRSLPEIGRRFGGRDHTTVLHAVRKVERLVEEDPNVAALTEKLRRQLDA